jgi:hypothetical protein
MNEAARQLKALGLPPIEGAGAATWLDIFNLLAPVQSVLPQQLTATTTVNGGGVDCLSAEVVAWLISIGAFGGTAPTLSLTVTIQDSNDNGVADAYANAQDFLGNAIQSAALTAASQVVFLPERGNRELNANSNFRPTRRFRRASAAATIGGTAPTIPLEVVALVMKRRLPTTATGVGN